MIHGCAHWTLTPRLHLRLLDLLFIYFFFILTWQRSEAKRVQIPSTSASLVLKCWNESQRPRAASETLRAAVPETPSTSGTPRGNTVKAAVHSRQKFPEKIETHSNAQLLHTHTSVFTRCGFVSFVYVHSMPGGGVHEDWGVKHGDEGCRGFKKLSYRRCKTPLVNKRLELKSLRADRVMLGCKQL